MYDSNYLFISLGYFSGLARSFGQVGVSKIFKLSTLLRYKTLDDLIGKTVATPGSLTTATLLFKIFTDGIDNIDMPFDRIMGAVDRNDVGAGLLIHEGQLTYRSLGYNKVLDFGELWEKETDGLPLPLGLDIVRKDLGEEMARRLSQGLQDSIQYGYEHQDEALPYAMRWGRGIDMKLGEKFVKMYVNELTIDMGEMGRKSLEVLFEKGRKKALIASVKRLEIY